MSRLEELFRPFYVLLMVISYVYFFVRLIPGIAAGVLLGRFGGERVFRRFRDRPAAVLLWNAGALALSILLGSLNGWLVLYVQKGRVLGGALAAGGFLTGRLWLHFSDNRNRED